MTTTLTQQPKGTVVRNRKGSVSLLLRGMFLAILLGIAGTQGVLAQLSGIKTIPGDYATIAAAVTDLNTQGVGPGGVTFNVAAGHTETLAARIELTATGTLADPIVFQKDASTSGANPLLTAYTGTALATGAAMDGMWALVGSDYVTISQIDLVDPNTTSATTMMEYGYGIFKASATNGASNNQIIGCTITLNRNNLSAPTSGPAFQGSNGIALLNCTPTTMQTNLTVTAASGASSNNKFYSNTIQNVNCGITLTGFADATPYALADTGNDIGGTSAGTGNTIINFGGGTGATVACAAVFVKDQWSFNVSYNTVNNNNGSGVNHPNTNRGIFANASSNGASATINNNNVTITGGTSTTAIDWAIDCEMAQSGANGNTISINNNTISITKTAASTVALTAIWAQSAPTTLNINGNTISNFTYGGTASSTTDVGVIRSGLAGVGTLNINNNTIGGVVTTGTTGTIFLIGSSGAPTTAVNINGNALNSLNTTGATTKSVVGISSTGGGANVTTSISNNNFQGITHAGSGALTFITATGAPLNQTINANTFTNITLANTGTVTFINHGYTIPAGGSLIISNNATVGNFTRTAAGAVTISTSNSVSGNGTVNNYINNNFSNFILTGASTVLGFNNTDGGTGSTKQVTGNTFNNWSGTTGTMNMMNFSYWNGASSVSNNTITNIAGQNSITGITIGATANNANPLQIFNNTINNLVSSGTGGAVNGIICNNTSAVINIYENTIHTLSSTGASAVNGFSIGGATNTSVYKNKVYNLTGSNASSTVNGILVSVGTLVNIHNNLIGDLKAPIANAANPLVGLNITGGTTVNASYNTVVLNATSTGALFGSSAISASTTPALTLRNNIFINNSAFTGTGLAVAYRRSGVSLATYGTSSNNNIFYAGVPGANRLIFTDGTNNDQVISAYKLRVAPADLNAATEDVVFLSTTGSSANFLHVDGSVASYTESGAANVSGITIDFDGDVRQGNVGYAGTGSAPDIGADEYNGTSIPAPAAPINFGSNTNTINSFNVTWEDNSTTEYGFLVYRSLNVSGPYILVGAVASTTTGGTGTTYSLAQTSLLGNTTYYYQVVANAANNSAALTGSAATSACGSGLIGSVLIPTTYPTISAAVADLKLLGMSGAVQLELESTYTGAGETYPIIISDTIGCLNATNTLTLRPEASVATPLTITSANTTATIDINGADYFTIDGRSGGVGTAKNLIISNTSTTSASSGNAILFRNEAQYNIVTYADVRSSNGNSAVSTVLSAAGAVPGAVAILGTTGVFGNDFITLSNNDIHSNGANLGVVIYAANGTTAGSTANNDSVSIVNNNIYDNFLAGSATAGIVVTSGNNNWTITGNSFYQTATRTYTTGTTHRSLWITPNTASLTSASGFNISDNYIGGTAPLAGGTPMTMNGAVANVYNGMDLSVGLGTATSVQNNIITNINFTTSSTSGTGIVGINVANGNVNVGTITGNVIGSATANSAIVYTTSGTGGGMIGLRSGAGGTINFSNNTVGGIDLNGTTATIATSFNGIAASGGLNNIINNNTVGHATLANSINNVTASTPTTAAAFRGIIMNSATTNAVCTITNNLVANMNNNNSATGTQSSPTLGIAATSGATTIENNTVRNLTSYSQITTGGANAAIVGIAYTSTSTVAPAIIRNNTIHTLKLANPAVTSAVTCQAIAYTGPTSGASNVIERNTIHSLSILNSANTAAILTGMDIGSGTVTLRNNMIRLGVDENGADVTAGCLLRGISKNTAIANIYHNSVWIGGSNVATSTVNTWAFARTAAATTDTILNNVFVNARSNASTGGKHYSVFLSATGTLVMNYNDYYVSGTGGVFALNGTTDVTSYSTGWVAGDANSFTFDPLFINPAGSASTGDLHIDPTNATIVEGTGTPVASVTTDYDLQTRSTLTPVDLGADAGNFVNLLCSGTPPASSAVLTGNTNDICVSGTRSMTLTGFSPAPGLTYQWQESANVGGPYVDVTTGTGGSTISYTTGTLTSTTYYQCVVTCSNGGLTTASSPVAVNVNNPTLSSTTPGTRCGVGTVLLQATAPVGTSVNWYANPTGGLPLFTGDNFTTPSISSTTTFYASASFGGSNFAGAKPAPTQVASTTAATYGLVFNATTNFTLVSVDVYPAAAAGTMTIVLQNSAGTTLQTLAGISYPAGSGSTPYTVALNFPVTAGTGYRLLATTSSTALIRETTGITYPYALGSAGSVTSGYIAGNTLTTYYYFYNWQISTGCESGRTPVLATVTPPPAVTVTNSSVVCNDSIKEISVTSTLSDYDSYIWSPATNLYEDAAATIPYAGGSLTTVYLKTATGGSYSYTLNANNSISLCANTTSVTFTVQPPTTAVISATPNPSCSGSPVVFTALVSSPGSAQIGNGTTSNTAGSAFTYRTFEGSHKQILYTAAELTALGFSAGNITSITFPVASVSGSPYNMDNFGIRLAHTTATALTAFQTVTYTNVYNAASWTPVPGDNVFNFVTPFSWDGTSNLLVDMYFDNDPNNTCSAGSPICWGNSAPMLSTTTSFTSCVASYSDNTTGVRDMSTITTVSATSTIRPNIKITGNKAATPNTFSWDNGSGVVGSTNPLTINPTANANYVVTATIDGCVIVSPSYSHVVTPLAPAPTASAPSTQCGYGVPTVSVTSGSGAATPFFLWYDAPSGGSLLQSSTSTTYTSVISATDTFYVAEFLNNCEGPRTMVIANVTAFDPISISAATTTCVGTANTFTVNQTGSTNTYAYTWSANPAPGSGVVGSPTGNPETFTASVQGVYSYIVTGFDATLGCTAIDTISVNNYGGITGTLTPTQISGCSNLTGFITANVTGAGTVLNEDFSSGVLPSNMTSAGNDFALVGGQMRFTSNTASKNGGVLITNTTGLANNDFQIDFDMITTPGSGSPADGFSYSYGPDVVALPTGTGSTVVGTTVAPNTTNPENGSGSGLKLGFDAYLNGANTPGLYLMYNCPVWNQTPTSTGVIAYINNTSWRATTTTGASTHVTIRINSLGQISMWLNNVQVVTNQPLPASYLTDDKSTWKHAFCGRTGAEFQGHFIDNLVIQYNNFYEYSIDGGATWSTANPIITPGPGTYTVDARYVSVPACSTSLGSATINTPSFTAVSSASSVCSYSPSMPTLSFSPAFTGATYQWESSPAGAGTWTPIAGATTATYVPLAGSITSDMDFRCVISCSGTPITGSPTTPVTITWDVPSVTSTTGGTRCGTGTVNLSGTSSAGSTLNWYAAATGGLPLGTGNNFTTPSISATTNFYTSAVSNGGLGLTPVPGGNTWNQYTTVGSFQSSTITGASMVFDALQPVTIQTIDIYPSATLGTSFTIEVRQTSGTGALVASYTGVTTVVNSGTPTVAQTVPVNFSIPAGTNYVIGFASNPATWRGNITNFPYPFTLPGYFNIQGSSFGTSPGTTLIYQYYFYNFVIATACASPRVAVPATVTAPPAVSVTANGAICNGSSYTLNATSVNDPNYSYVWNTGYNGASYVVSPTSTTSYTVTATDTSAGANAGCATQVTRTVTVNPVPATPVITQNPLIVCGNSPVTISAVSTQPGVAQVGTGTGTNVTTGQSPYTGNWEGSHIQYLITAAELNALNVYAGQITSLGFNVTNATTTFAMSQYTIKMGATASTALTGYETGLNVVYTAPGTILPTAGWNSYTFNTPFNWNGTSNVVIEICHNNDPDGSCGGCFAGTSTVQSTTTAFTSVYGQYADNTTTINPWDMCSGANTGTTSTGTNRPNMQLGYGAETTFLWSNGSTNDTIIVTPPTGATTYTVTATNTFGCTSSDSITVNAASPALPFISTNDTTLCSPNFVYVNVDDAGPYSGGYPAGTQFEWLSVGGQIVPPTPDLDTIPSTFGSTYYAIITLPNGCTAISDTATILTKAVAIVDTITNATCTGGGSILATVTSGIAPYNYVWSTDLAQTNIVRNVTSSANQDTLIGLSAGTYYLSVSDEFGNPGSCNSGVIAYIVTGSNPIVATVTGTDITCNGFGDGSATVNWTGGTSPFSILWSDGNTNATRAVSSASTLTVIVSDLSGCADTASVTINEPSAISLSLSSTNESAPAANDGTVSVVVSGGTPGYLIDWYDAGFVQVGSGSPLGGLTGGVYTCLVTDTNGCQGFDNVTVNTNTNVTLNLTMLIEGMYDGVSGLVPALLNSGVGVSSTECDTIIVEIRDQVSPTTVLASGTAVLGTNGQASFTFPASISGATGYIAVFHRNAVQTWSDLVTFSPTTNFNFTTAATQAFSSNQREVSPGVWAMYSGDLAPQDEFIDILDQSVIDNDIFNFAGGYVVSDLNGDGFVDIVDQSIVDNNIFNFIGSIHP